MFTKVTEITKADTHRKEVLNFFRAYKTLYLYFPAENLNIEHFYNSRTHTIHNN